MGVIKNKKETTYFSCKESYHVISNIFTRVQRIKYYQLIYQKNKNKNTANWSPDENNLIDTQNNSIPKFATVNFLQYLVFKIHQN